MDQIEALSYADRKIFQYIVQFGVVPGILELPRIVFASLYVHGEISIIPQMTGQPFYEYRSTIVEITDDEREQVVVDKDELCALLSCAHKYADLSVRVEKLRKKCNQ